MSSSPSSRETRFISTDLSLCVVARGGAAGLEACLSSVAGVVDEIVVVDAGASGRAREVARQLDARLIPYTWQGDAAAAKNTAVEAAAGDWLLFLEADEVVTPESAGNLRLLTAKRPASPRCCRLLRRETLHRAGRPVTVLTPVDRLFTRDPRLHFVRPVYAQLVHLDGSDALEIVATDRVQIERVGPGRTRLDREAAMALDRLIAESPDEAVNYYYLGCDLVEGGVPRGLDLLCEAIRRARPEAGDGWLADAYRRAVAGLLLVGRYDEAVALGEAAVARLDDGGVWCQLGLARAAARDDERAVECLERAYAARDRPVLGPTDLSTLTWRPLLALAAIAERQSDLAGAYGRLLEACRYLPGDRDLLDRTERVLRGATRRPVADLPAGPPAQGRIVFFAGPSLEPWNPTNLERGGIGGSETAVIHVARELRALGYDVAVYNDPGAPGVFEGVPYLDWRRYDPTRPCDLFVSVRQPEVFDFPIGTPIKWLWMHDATVGPLLTPARLAKIDYVLTLSEWHRAVLQAQYGIPTGKLLITRNGLDLDRFRGNPPRQRHRFVYSSAPNRGLDRILTLWPRIRDLWPDAELHVFYGWKSYDESLRRQPERADELLALKAKILSQIDQPGVCFHDRVDQRRLAEEFLSSEVWFYPTAWRETFCITALEAQAAGCIPVTNDLAALAEVVRGGIVLPFGSNDDTYLAALRRLDDPELRAELAREGREWVAGFSWTAVAREWHLRLSARRAISR